MQKPITHTGLNDWNRCIRIIPRLLLIHLSNAPLWLLLRESWILDPSLWRVFIFVPAVPALTEWLSVFLCFSPVVLVRRTHSLNPLIHYKALATSEHWFLQGVVREVPALRVTYRDASAWKSSLEGREKVTWATWASLPFRCGGSGCPEKAMGD